MIDSPKTYPLGGRLSTSSIWSAQEHGKRKSSIEHPIQQKTEHPMRHVPGEGSIIRLKGGIDVIDGKQSSKGWQS